MLGTWEKCPVCNKYSYGGHRNIPKWEIAIADYHERDDPACVCATDSSDAAEKAAERWFSNLDYPEEIEIAVRPWKDERDEEEENEPWEVYEVRVQPVPEFTAYLKDPKEEPA